MGTENPDHRLYEEYAVRHVMGGLGDAEAQVFRSHLLDCEECRMRVGELRSIASELADVERAERREKVARALETKQREEELPDLGPDEDATPRGSRVIGTIVVVLLIGGLALWNFMLRGENNTLHTALQAERDAANIINFGDRWPNEVEAAGVKGVARVSGRDLALMVEGTADDITYHVTFYDQAGGALLDQPVTSEDGRLRYLRRNLPAGATRVDVSQAAGGGTTVILRAARPDTAV